MEDLTLAIGVPVVSTSANETVQIGASFAPRLVEGSVLALYGSLGAGKTQFVKGICSSLGIPESTVNSPTFTIVNEYGSRKASIYHFDAYRISRIDEFYELGYEDYFFSDGICLVEWPDRVESLLPSDTLRIRFTHLGGDRREILLFDGG